MKTAREWFQEIEDEEVRGKAIENTRPKDLAIEYRSLSSAIGGSFIWIKTPQGQDYWAKVERNTKKKLV